MIELFYIGLAINVIGDLLLGGYAVKFALAMRQARNMPLRQAELRSHWADKRRMAFALMLVGAIITAAAAAFA